MIGQKKVQNLRVVSGVFWRSWMKADKAGSNFKFQPLNML